MKIIYYFYLTILYIYSINASSDIRYILFDNESISVDNLNDTSLFDLDVETSLRVPNYLKIFVKGHNEFKADVDHIISYYQRDKTFQKRNQYSQSLYGNTTMWLNRR